MCGIAGILHFDGRSPAPDMLQRMRLRLADRGPDGQGDFQDGPCGLSHARLAVLDLPGGAQPMTRGGITVVFNGEIYNHRALRTELQALGHHFQSHHADTEVVVLGYRQWGVDLVRRLDGMFALAIWDAGSRRLFLARDRAGKKPLMILRDGRRCVFASTVAGVLAGLESTPPLDHEAIDHYLAFGYTDERSLYSGITELPAGHWQTLDADGRGERQAYWRPPPCDDRSPWPVEDVESLIRQAVEQRLESDVPIGCFLSGGIDSSLVAMFAQQAMARQGGRLRTFSVSMPDARYDEGPVARLVADHLGTEHREFTAQPEVEQDLRLLIRSSGQPLGDSSILPTFWISRAARREATVALTGDGGDELFGGYDRYRALRLLRTHRWWMRHLPRWSGSDTRSLGDRMGRLARAARQADPARQYLTIVGMFDTEAWTAAAFDADLDPVDAARRFDFARYLPFDLLRKIDRASMACGLEVRCPMLDTTVMEQALRRTFDALCPTGQLKGLLREMAARRLPPPIARRRKSGFSIPLARWFRTTLKPMTRQWLLEVSLEPHFDRPGLERLIDEHARGKADHAQRLFALVSLSMWLAEARGT